MRRGKQIRRHDHHQRGPRLLAEERDAEEHDRDVGRGLRHEHDERHHRGAGAERDLARARSATSRGCSSQPENQPPTRQPTPAAA